MDDPVESLSELEANLRDIERANRWLGGISPVKSAIFRSGAKTVLDVGCGSGDIALALVEHASDQCRELSVTCLDISEQMLAIARTRTANHPSLQFLQADARELPYADGAYDVVMCNLALHHFEPHAAQALLREMRRVAAVTPLVCDLRRAALGVVGAWLFSRLASRNRLTRHDAPLSARRAYTPDEAVQMARAAGWRNPQARRLPFYRMLISDA